MHTTNFPRYEPKTPAGRAIMRWANEGTLSRRSLASALRTLRYYTQGEGPYAARHCLAYVDYIGAYPHRARCQCGAAAEAGEHACNCGAWLCPDCDPTGASDTPKRYQCPECRIDDCALILDGTASGWDM